MLKAFHKKERTPLGFCEGLDKAFPNFGQEDERGSGPPKYHTNYAPFYPFHKATCRGDIDRVKKFVEQGTAAMEQIDWKSRTALHFACVYGQPEVVELLLKSHCDINPKDSKEATPLIKAAQCQQKRCLALLLKYGADPNLTDFRGNTALHYAVYNEDFQVAACLLKYNANLEALNENRMTPLLLALKQNKEDIAEFLINRGADIHITDFLGRTTLMYAVRCGSELITNLLLQRGINTNKTDAFGWTAKRYAVESKSKIRKILIDYDEEQLENQKGNSENKEKGVGSLPTMELKESLQVEPVEKADTEPLKSEPVLEVPSEKQPKIPIKPESSASFQPLKTFDRMSQQCVYHLSESSEERGRPKGRVLPWVEKDVPSKPSGNVQKSSSDGVEMTMLQPFTSEQVIEVSDKDQAKNDSNENTQHRTIISEPLPQKKDAAHLAGASVQRRDTMSDFELKMSGKDVTPRKEQRRQKSSTSGEPLTKKIMSSKQGKLTFSFKPEPQKKDAFQRREPMGSSKLKVSGKDVTSTADQRRQKSSTVTTTSTSKEDATPDSSLSSLLRNLEQSFDF